MRRRRRPAAVESAAAAFAAASVPALAAWLVGQALDDRFAWSQFIFWVPSFAAFALAIACIVASRLMHAGPRVRRAVAVVGIAVAAVAGTRAARWEFGWRPWPARAGADEVVVTHWNPQWPGEGALACGRALAPNLGDVCIVSNPGSITRSVVAREWVPSGMRVADLGQFSVVSRHPVAACELLTVEQPPGVGLVWAGWVVIEVPGGGSLRILVVDLPSEPRMARASAAAALDAALARTLGERAPDLVVGDLNATPGGRVSAVLGRFGRSAPPWCAFGWLCTFERPWPMLRIDAMLASRAFEWRGYRTLDLGIGEHRMQVGIVARAGTGAVSASSGR